MVRAGRLLDSCIDLSGANVCKPEWAYHDLLNISSSRFLRPVNKNKHINALRLARIRTAMKTAAKANAGFHLWWHPHNFGKNLRENIGGLKHILDFYQTLEYKYGMKSLNMTEIHSTSSQIYDN